MEKINDFESVIIALKNNQVIMIHSPISTNFTLRDKKICVKTENAQYYLSLDEFKKLFEHSIFFYYERKLTSEIETQKDEEYYAWKHK